MDKSLFSKGPLSIRYLALADGIRRKEDTVPALTSHILDWKSLALHDQNPTSFVMRKNGAIALRHTGVFCIIK